MTQFMQAPIFEADQHMYETAEALTKYLPEKYSRAVQFAQLGRHTRIAINGVISDYIPNPTFERVAAPGAAREVLRGRQQAGLTLREMQGNAIEPRPRRPLATERRTLAGTAAPRRRARGLRPTDSRWRSSPDCHVPEPQSWSRSWHSHAAR
jgi:hypothetical protein